MVFISGTACFEVPSCIASPLGGWPFWGMHNPRLGSWCGCHPGCGTEQGATRPVGWARGGRRPGLEAAPATARVHPPTRMQSGRRAPKQASAHGGVGPGPGRRRIGAHGWHTRHPLFWIPNVGFASAAPVPNVGRCPLPADSPNCLVKQAGQEKKEWF